MLWCIGITDLKGVGPLWESLSRSSCSFFIKDGKFFYDIYEFYIFDDSDFSVECIRCDYLIKCINLGIVIKGVKKDNWLGSNSDEHYSIEVTSPLFLKDIKLVKHTNISKLTGYFNENFCRCFGVSVPCKFLKAINYYYSINDSNTLCGLTRSEFSANASITEPYFIDTDTNRFILGDFESGRAKVLNCKTYLGFENCFSVIDLLDNYWFGNGIIGFSFNDNIIEVNTLTSIYKFELSDRLKLWVLKRRLCKQGIFFDDSKRRIKHSSP